MSEVKEVRLIKAAKEFNVATSTIVDFLKKKGHDIDSNPNSKLSPEWYALLAKEYSSDIKAKIEAEQISLKGFREKKETDAEHALKELKKLREEEEEDNMPDILIKDTASGKLTSLTSLSQEKEKEKEKEKEREREKEKEKEKENKIQLTIKGKLEDFVKPQPKEPLPEQPAEIQPEASSQQPETPPETPSGETPLAEKEQAAPEEKPAEQKVIRLVETVKLEGPHLTGEKIDLNQNWNTKPAKKTRQELEKERRARVQQHKNAVAAAKLAEQKKNKQLSETQRKPEHLNLPGIRLEGPVVVGEISLTPDAQKGKRKRIPKDTQKIEYANNKQQKKPDTHQGKRKKKALHTAINDEDVQKQVKETLLRLTSKNSKSKSSKYRRDKREAISQRIQEEEEQMQLQQNVLKVTEFASVNELASLMNVPVNQVIGTCMAMGLIVSINQRLDAETMALVADEFHFKVEFIGADEQNVTEERDSEEDLLPRPPIVTVMGHVDHGKTKLLDYIRNTNVIAGEAGGITQHIGAYNVQLENGRQITFLDTPGHEAFTAMRARGAKITDVVIIVVAADDGVKQQTIEAINHASAAGVPIVFAINKIDKPDANPDKVKEELANMNYLIEEWGGKYQSQDISAKAGINVDLLLEKVLLEAELLELKANPKRLAVGSVLESSLDKGRGYVATVLVQNGTLRTGDVVLAGNYAGHVKAMYNERNQKIEEAGPSMPLLLLGLDGAPQAGDSLNVMNDFREARDIAAKRSQLQREQGMRTKKHITLDEIGRRIAIGNFQELNIIVKGDVDGSIEALSDSLIKLSTPEIQVNVIHKAVGQISESDVSLAAASNAVIVGFQVRPSQNARKLAEQEQIDVRIYSIIYDAIEEIKAAMEGMLSPEIKEEIVATLEVLEVFRISKVGTVAGCIVREGKITRTTKVRIIRDGIVIHSGEIGTLKRLKEDVKEVSSGYECGLDISNFNDIQVKDIIEGYHEFEVKKKL
ncbi:MAG: translation initiation factor IF-2 [Bacteroidales bacterium]|jgi:translation initiation factor IF-2|nr:translation initiation factor IF-2 [Bacteroidales bacterium]